MRELQRIELRRAPFHAAIGRAFNEMDARDGWKTLDVFHRQQQGPTDKPVDHQPVLLRIYGRAAAVVTLEEQAIGGDDPGLILQRRKADRGFLTGREPGNVAPDHVFDELRRLPVRPINDAGTQSLRPRRILRRKGVRRTGLCRTAPEQGAARHCGAELQERAAAACVNNGAITPEDGYLPAKDRQHISAP
jgi:hypothetical protein